jgi:hypothetical protein
MRIIKLKDLLREIQLQEAPVADTPPPIVKFVTPPNSPAYAKAASDGAGKAYTQQNIDFTGLGDTSGVKSSKLAMALNIARGAGDLVDKAAELIRPEENNKNMKIVTVKGQKYKNYDKATDTWHPYPDKGGWSIGYGHWSPNKPSGPITDKQAEINLKNDIKSKMDLAGRLIKNFEKFPDAVKLGLINSLYRGEKSPNAFRELNKPDPNFLEAAKAYITTKDKSAVERMKMNAALIASGQASKPRTK